MGSIYAARFSKAGHDVIAIDVWQDHVDYINKNGLLIEGPDGQIIAKKIRASTNISDVKGCDFYIIATKAMKLEESIKNLKKYFNTIRPQDLANSIGIDLDSDQTTMASAQTESYPSGHTTQAYLLAYTLIDRYPQLQSELLDLAYDISIARIERGVHYPSDMHGGIQLAKYLHHSGPSVPLI